MSYFYGGVWGLFIYKWILFLPFAYNVGGIQPLNMLIPVVWYGMESMDFFRLSWKIYASYLFVGYL